MDDHEVYLYRGELPIFINSRSLYDWKNSLLDNAVIRVLF